VNPNRVRVVRTGDVELAPSSAAPQAVADGDRLFVSEAGGVAILDAETFEISDRWTLDGTITGLGMSPDGDHLYATTPDQIIVFDVDTGDRIHSVDVEGAIALEHVR
jgi:hypothetical protein